MNRKKSLNLITMFTGIIKKSWHTAKQDKQTVLKFTEEFKISVTTARILANRGLTEIKQVREFLCKPLSLLHDPFLMDGMEAAVKRIHAALKNREKVMIYGDYDADGISSVCLLYIFLKNAGFDVCYYIPDRFEEGYGLNKEALKKASDNNIDLVIAVDCGITAVKEAGYAKELGLDLIITDHHECHGVLPEAAAVLNPKKPDCAYPFKELAGAGVAFKLAEAYAKKYEMDFKPGFYCEFAAVGTVADIMPLTGENRILVNLGLLSMRISENHGIKALLGAYYKFKEKKNISADIISYYMAPRINAAGRLYKPELAAELFLAESKEAAAAAAEDLNGINKRRQDMEKEIFIQAEEKIDEIKDFAGKKIIVLYTDEWNQGVIGIAASKLAEKYNKTFILLAKDSGGVYVGSCRSAGSLNITEALKSCGDILLKFGGHEKAAGLSIQYDKINELDIRLNQYLRDSGAAEDDRKIYNIECELEPGDFDLSAAREIELLEPFGAGNPAPLFIISKSRIINIIPMKENKHLRLELHNKINFEAVYFNMEPENFRFDKFDLIDIACSAGINDYSGREKVQFIIKDVRFSGWDGLDIYEKFIQGGENTEIEPEHIPQRNDYITVYNFLVNFLEKDVWYEKNYNIDKIYGKLPEPKNISGFKFRIILDIFKEAKIIDIEHDLYFIKKIKINAKSGKTDLEQTKIYIKLKKMQEAR